MDFTLPASRKYLAWLLAFPAAGLFFRPAEGNETESARLKNCSYDLIAEMPINYYGRTLATTVAGTLNGAPAVLLIDTGASTLLTPFGVDKHHLVRSQKTGWAGGLAGVTPTYSVAIENLRIGQLTLSGAGSLRAIDETNPRADFDAFLGAEHLLQMDMELNLRDKQIKFFKATHCANQFLAYWDAEASSVPLRLAGNGKLPMIDVFVDGVRLRALVDSGADVTTIYSSVLPKLGLSVHADGMIAGKNGGGIGPTSFKTYSYRFKSFSIGGKQFLNPELSVIERQDKDIDMLLGADFLRTHRVLMAPSQDKLYFSQLDSSPFFPVETHDWVIQEAVHGNHYAQFKLAISKTAGTAPERSRWMQASLAQNNPLALRYLAKQRENAGSLQEASALYARAIEHDPFDLRAQLALFRARIKAGQVDLANASLREAIAGVDGNRWPAMIARYYLGDVPFDAVLHQAGLVNHAAQGRRCEAYLYSVTLLKAQGNAQAAKVADTAWRDTCRETTASETR